MIELICELSDLPVSQCACRLHAKPEERAASLDAGGRDGYPAAGAAEVLARSERTEITEPSALRTLERIRAATSSTAAVHELALYCADSAHWWPNFRQMRAEIVAALAVAVAERGQAEPAAVLALIEDAGPVPWEKPRTDWVADVNAIFARRFGARDTPP